jgi:phosphate transport system permease protein
LVNRTLKKRYAAERRFRLYGLCSVAAAIIFLVWLLGSIVLSGLPAFQKTFIQLDITFDPDVLDISDPEDSGQLRTANYEGLVKEALKARFPDVKGRSDRRSLYSLVSDGAVCRLNDMLRNNPDLLNTAQSLWLVADDDVDVYFKEGAGDGGRLNEKQLSWLNVLVESGDVDQRFNWTLLTAGDSREPELAGIRGALVGSFYTLLVTLLLSFPIGVAASVYLEEFAPRNKWTDLIEVNINNLAAVPSIVFGLLGLAVFINFFGLPRSAPLVGGLVLTLMTLPTIVIAGRAAIKSVPPSIRQAALGIGASKMQTVTHHVLPLALPGMLTGTIIGMARALGETAPLLMIGMVAFIVDIPDGFLAPATALPVQIFLWADSPERGFAALTSAAIMVLLVFLVSMNLLAVLLRKRFERRW